MAASESIELVGQEEVERWLDEDAALIENSAVWKEYLSSRTDRVYNYEIAGDAAVWLKIVGEVETTLEEISDLLDQRLLERQHEWHFLFLEGRIVARDEARKLELCYMAYDSGHVLVSNRDFVYYKARRDIEVEGRQGFQLSYRTLPAAESLRVAEAKRCVRGEFQACHRVVRLDDRTVQYVYTQRADPKGLIPLFLTHRTQASILLKEIVGVRRATSLEKKSASTT